MPNQTKWNHLKNSPVVKAIVWVVAMAGWPFLFLEIIDWFDDYSYFLNETTGRYELDFFSFLYAIRRPAAISLLMAGWIIITYLCIGKKSSATVVVIYFAIYVSPLPMYLTSKWDCGPIPEWKCRWTCKTVQELKNLGAVDDNFYVRDYGPIGYGGNDMRKVYGAGGLCN